ncbi:hypothetical protein EQG49_02400 [Periweissella cryptocerci]|uniref:Uncharacterized protein n=1 Tax=Periweissella cryptocerci TaxID=2506420 RepID=A0A4V1AIG2_9LACO|nr:hypothetical protein [Periweissella cryptocerci]QBO35395.1 hypothetical protein EQG49_02400 [Periweissella cryptocerci]
MTTLEQIQRSILAGAKRTMQAKSAFRHDLYENGRQTVAWNDNYDQRLMVYREMAELHGIVDRYDRLEMRMGSKVFTQTFGANGAIKYEEVKNDKVS